MLVIQGTTRRRRARLLRVARVGVVHLDVDRGAARARATGCSTSATRSAPRRRRRSTTSRRRKIIVVGIGLLALLPARPRGHDVGSTAGTPRCSSACGIVLGVGVHPIDDPSPLMSVLLGDGEGGLALALRSSTRAVPVLAARAGAECGRARGGVPDVTLPRAGRDCDRATSGPSLARGHRDLRGRQPPVAAQRWVRRPPTRTRPGSAAGVARRRGAPRRAPRRLPRAPAARRASSVRSAGGTPSTSRCRG